MSAAHSPKCCKRQVFSKTYSAISCGLQTTSRIMIVLVSTLCLLAAVVTGKESDCCRLSVGFDACRNSCNKLNALTDVQKKAQQLLELPLNCPAHLVKFWSCLNSSIPIFNGLSKDVNLTKFPASCCLLVVSVQSCRDACFSGKLTEIDKLCREEAKMYRCIKRYEASQKCCIKASPTCVGACQVVFASDNEPNKNQKQNVVTSCRKQKGGNYVKRCVKNMTDFPSVRGDTQMRCCSKANNMKCRSRCNREVRSSRTKTAEEIFNNLMKDCGKPLNNIEFKFWTCFLTTGEKKPPIELKGVDGAKLQCCSKARSTKCWQLCVKMHSSKTGRTQSWEQFAMECTDYAANEASLMRCLSDVTEPCQLGCSGLSFCTNFNNRHTEMFRSCNLGSDRRAKHQLQEWEKGLIGMPSRVIAVQNIRKCLPETWKAIACILQIKPCSSRTHKSTICRSDCIKILKQCGNSTFSRKQNPFEICDELSPSEDQSGCLSLSDYLKPSEFIGNLNEVTHPCQPSPCHEKGNICNIDRSCYEASPTLSRCQPHKCKPGCPLGDASGFYVRMGEYARILVGGKHGCFQACYCNELGKLTRCKNLECVQSKGCFVDPQYRDDNTQFHIDCNFCTCFDAERICTRRHCKQARSKRYQFVYGNSSQDLNNLHEGMPCGCKPNHMPVCGSDGITYANPCIARCAGLKNTQSKQGSCESLDPCTPNPCREGERCVVERKVCLSVDEPCNQYHCEKEGIFCDNTALEPVCDQDNVQHPNPCSIHFRKKKMAYKGFCKEACKRPTTPVCGLNGETYNSKCVANDFRVLVDYEGHCSAIGYKKVMEIFSEDEVHCAGIKCPNITPGECRGIIPPGACCPLCAAQLRILFSTRQLKINSDGIKDKGPVTLHHLLSSLRRHVTTSECDLFGYVSMDGDIVVHIMVVTKTPTPLQVKACNAEAQKIEVFINTGSPAFGSDIVLSALKGAKSDLPSLRAKSKGAVHVTSCALLLAFSLLKVYFTLKYILTSR